MKLMRLAGSASVACSLTLALAAPALASDVDLSSTGPDSHQSVVIENSTTINTTNTNVVTVVNENDQTAATGDVSASKNTNVGSAVNDDPASGSASNVNTTTTTISIDNPSENCCGLGGENGGNLPGNGNDGAHGGSQPTGGQGGNVLGASTGGLGGGSALLPVTGASSPVDVSALRAAFDAAQASHAPAANLVKQTRNLSGLMLLAAALVLMAGAISSVVYSRRKEGRV